MGRFVNFRKVDNNVLSNMIVRVELVEAKIDDWRATKLQLVRYYRTKPYNVSTQEFGKASGPAKSIKLPNFLPVKVERSDDNNGGQENTTGNIYDSENDKKFWLSIENSTKDVIITTL